MVEQHHVQWPPLPVPAVPYVSGFKVVLAVFDRVDLAGVCMSVADIAGRARLRSAERHEMLVPRSRIQLCRRRFHVTTSTVGDVRPLRTATLALRLWPWRWP